MKLIWFDDQEDNQDHGVASVYMTNIFATEEVFYTSARAIRPCVQSPQSTRGAG